MRILLSTLLILIGAILIALPVAFANPAGQAELPEVYVEALGTANLRSGPSVEYNVIGEIAAGTQYRVLARHIRVPWLLLEVPSLPTQAGWVYIDLVKIRQGNLNSVRNESEFKELPLVSNVTTTATVTSPVTAIVTGSPAAISAPMATLSIPATATNLVTAKLLGRSNIRYGPGIEYPAIVTLDEGTVLTVLARHSYYPWYKVAVEGSPNGEGWVYAENVEIRGNINTLPVISELNVPFPTPSATPDTVISDTSPWPGFGTTDSTALIRDLGNPVHNFMLSQELVPRTDREGSVFVMDLETQQHFTLNGEVAYSGMSIIKIPILLRYFIHKFTPLTPEDAALIAQTMICSENITTNTMLTTIGDGDILEGAQRVTDMLLNLGLGNSFVVGPISTGGDATPAPVTSIQTQVDQSRTQPDPFNQFTVEEVGWLLGAIYQCAMDESGPLMEAYPEQLDQLKCRQILRAMSANKLNALIESGVPRGTVVAHKHGWINDTHGDAGIILSEEKPYALVMVYHERTSWLKSEKSFPVLAEISRQTWNYFNPQNPVAQIFPADVPGGCDIYSDPTVVADLLGSSISLAGLP